MIANKETFAKVFAVSRETVARLEIYAGLLARWQKAVNLVAPSTLDTVWDRHFADSAQLVALVPGARRWLDLGSGAGFLGLVVAIIGQERTLSKTTLIESDVRKCAFLRDVVRTLDLGNAVDIITERIENPANRAKVGAVDVVSARALAPLDRLLSLAHPYFGVETVGVFPKGRDLAAEIAAAQQNWAFDCRRCPSATDAQAGIAVIRSLRAKTEDDP